MARLVVAVGILLSALVACGDDDDGVDVVEEAPVEIIAAPGAGEAPLEVELEVAPDDRRGLSAVEYRWDFGDGGRATGEAVTHVYAEPGTYTVSVEVAEGDDADIVGFGEVDIEVAPTPTVPADDPAPSADPPPFDEWAAGVNDACAASVEAQKEVELEFGDPTAPAALRALVEVNRTETAAIEAAGVPDERTDEATAWLERRAEGSALFEELAGSAPVDPTDPRIAELNSIGADLEGMSTALGLTECTSQG